MIDNNRGQFTDMVNDIQKAIHLRAECHDLESRIHVVTARAMIRRNVTKATIIAIRQLACQLEGKYKDLLDLGSSLIESIDELEASDS